MRSVALLLLLAAPLAQAQVVTPVGRQRCPDPQLPTGSLTFSAGQSSVFGPVAVFTVRVDGQHLYWSDGMGRLWRAPKSGGAATSLVKERAGGFLLLGDSLYFTADKAIRRVPAAGGASELVASEHEDPIELVSDGRHLFYSMFDGSPVRQLALGKGDPGAPGLPSGKVVRRFPVVGKSVLLAVEGGDLYVASYKAGTLTRYPLRGGAPRVLVRGERTIVAVSVDESAIYYSVEKGGFVKRLPKKGGRPLTLIQGMDNQETLFLDGPHVYWFDWTGGSGQHTLWRTLRSGTGKPERVQGGLCESHHLAIDETHLYIANKGAGTVLKIPKPR